MIIRCYKTALGYEDGMVDLNTPIKKSGSFRVGLASIGKFDDVPVHAETVAMTTLDALLARDGTDVVDLVKVDVEGAEALVLSGCNHLFDVVRPVGTSSWMNAALACFVAPPAKFSTVLRRHGMMPISLMSRCAWCG